jgi:SIT family siderophore-iron:H+ symporter-like MFS transporter
MGPVEVIIADMSSLKNRLFFTFVPATPFLINTWVSGNIVAKTLDTSTWRWGIGMFGIIYPGTQSYKTKADPPDCLVACTLLLSVLVMAQIKARRSGSLADYKSPFQAQGSRLFTSLFWQIDVIGILLIIVAAGFFLVPFTLARGNAQSWQQAHIIAPVIIGILTFPVLFIWERRCKFPLIPFHVSTDQPVKECMLIW